MPKAGVGMFLVPCWAVFAACFNPFMPKAGVGICSEGSIQNLIRKFQSIYAQSGRWNCYNRAGKAV